MRRRRLNICCVVSLIFSLATAGLWVRSDYVADRVGFIHRHAPMQTSSASVWTWSGLFYVVATFKQKGDYGDPHNTLFGYTTQAIGGPVSPSFWHIDSRWSGFRGSWGKWYFRLIVPA